MFNLHIIEVKMCHYLEVVVVYMINYLVILFNSLHWYHFTLQGQFNIISLSSFLPQSGNDGEHSSLNVLLAGSDGRVFGGVVGMLTAASPVQIIVGSFVPNGKKSSSNILKSGPSSAPTPKLLYFGGSMSATSPTFQGPSSESYEGNDHSSFRGPELYNNNMQMDHHPLWDGHNLWKMLL
ncbi:putative PPC domain-containing protein [Lupinus albus]|uniref:AT-hook motif nuclear-localized protein n=1 Tax=Lupinus albus TaxID=3870 RepID=A0A6A4Q1L6_LUPAL|nr:putative PPC domain-containing protein [Lupinus albus]